jgi:iron complex transport system substrate-binding protein
VVTFTPRTLADVWQGIRDIGAAAGRAAEAAALASRLEQDVAAVADAAADGPERPRVLCLEWFDPLFVGGHWVPEMVRLAGGRDPFGREGEPSFTIGWPDVISAQPEVVVLMSCGYGRARNIETWRTTPLPPEWDALPAVKVGRVYAVDANAYFSRSGPRLAQGVALLASLCHPDRTLPVGAPYDFEVVPPLGSVPCARASATADTPLKNV